MEPEHSQQYPLQKIEIVLPQLFESKSILLRSKEETLLKIVDVYYKEKSPFIEQLMKETEYNFAKIDEQVDEETLSKLDETFFKA